MIVAVGSTNPTKITPVKTIFSKHFKHVVVKGVAARSGVAEQPMSDEEMYKGAVNRARQALANVKGAKYGVGIEGGVHKYSYGWFERSIIVIVDAKGGIGIGSSGGLHLPKRIVHDLKRGKNLEQSVDRLFGTKKIGSGIGMFGMMTNKVVTRASGVAHGVAFALARFLHEDLYS